MFNDDQITKLKAPLPSTVVQSRGESGRQLSYIEGWYAIKRANDVFGFEGWNSQVVRLEETSRELMMITKTDYRTKAQYEAEQWRVSYLAQVRVTVTAGESVVIRDGIGFGSGFADKNQLGSALESAVKEAETDALKRALRTFGNGFGLALYDKTQANVEVVKAIPEQVKELITYARENGLEVAEIKALCSASGLPATAAQYKTQAQVTTLSELIENEIAKRSV